VNDAAVVAGLVRGEAGLRLEDDRWASAFSQRHCRRQSDDSTADYDRWTSIRIHFALNPDAPAI
jgi:hypothetical protein